MSKRLLAQGAEAKLYEENGLIIKQRFQKTYRVHELDNTLRKSRTKRERTILEKLHDIGFPCPKVIDAEETQLTIQQLSGNLLKKEIEKSPTYYAKQVGQQLSILHNNQIIHGDLTTSNMMVCKKKLYFIDFGLSFISHKVEDKAVDLHLLFEGLTSTHPKQAQKIITTIKKIYQKDAEQGSDILNRLEKVQKRGRYRGKH